MQKSAPPKSTGTQCELNPEESFTAAAEAEADVATAGAAAVGAKAKARPGGNPPKSALHHAAKQVASGLGRTVALHHRSSTSHQIH